MIESEQMKHGRMEIVVVHAVFDGVIADVVSGAVYVFTTDSFLISVLLDRRIQPAGYFSAQCR
jgi:hypothetical protein